MAPSATATATVWDHEYDTLRRAKLFANPPTDHSAYPALQEAVNPHIESFNAIFRGSSDDGRIRGLMAEAIAEIGTKTYLDGDDRAAAAGKNRLRIRYRNVTLQKSQIPPSNKLAKNREVLPAECRERHVTYRGKLTATLEYQINDGDPVEFVRDLGQLPIMVKVSLPRQTAWFQTAMDLPRNAASQEVLSEPSKLLVRVVFVPCLVKHLSADLD